MVLSSVFNVEDILFPNTTSGGWPRASRAGEAGGDGRGEAM